jgi:arylsulfatase
MVRPCTGIGEELRIRLLRRLPPEGPAAVEARLGGETVAAVELASGANQLQLPLPSGRFTPVPVDLVFRRPANAPETSFALTRAGLPAAASEPTCVREGSEWRLALGSPGVWVAPLALPAGARTLELDARVGGRGALAITALDANGTRYELASVRADPRGAWTPLAVDFRALAGGSVLVLAQIGPGTRADLRAPYLKSQPSAPPPSPPSRSRSRSRAGRSPDVVLILLDAARGDRFSGAYARETIPRIRAELADALLFRRAYAECPTTSCSVPAIVTGASFLAGGDVFTGRRLPDELVTLAESLTAAGYHTVGLSASPNNSAQRNSTQGFAEFRELWGKGNPAWGPASQARLAAEAIAAAPADRPLYLQLHFLPPHQPYEPPPAFDRFTDPSYRGLVTPRMSLAPYNLGLASLPPADLAQLVGLYDGNLLLADDLVAQVLAALEANSRFENSLIVLTSDHGEAFMEHGHQGHNTTLYDEMLHVPLLVRLPGGERPPGVDFDRVASSLDIVPTVLSTLGLPAPPEVDGLDLLGPSPDPRRPRVLFHRTSAPEGTAYAVRAGRFKAISRPSHARQQLFDLEQDPGETENRVLERPEIFAGLGLLLTQHLAASGNAPTGEAVELDAEARETLEVLGYVDD